MTKKPKTQTVQELQATIADQERKLKSFRQEMTQVGKDRHDLSDLKHQVGQLKEAFRELDPFLKGELKSTQSLSNEEIGSIRKSMEKAQHDARDGLATESIKPALESLLLQRGEALTEVSFVKVDGNWRATLSYVEIEETPDYTSFTPKFFSSIKSRVKVHSVDAETLVGSISGLKEPPPKKSAMSTFSRYSRFSR
jgi:hypothetical protein